MKDLLVLLSKEMPLELHIAEMERGIAQLKEAQLSESNQDEAKKKVLLAATMISLKLGTEHKNTEEVLHELDKAHEGHELMDRLTGDNKQS